MLLAVAQGIGACLAERVDAVLMNTSELGGRLSPAIHFEILAFAFAARSREGLKEREEGRKGVELERIVVVAAAASRSNRRKDVVRTNIKLRVENVGLSPEVGDWLENTSGVEGKNSESDTLSSLPSKIII